jgi:hypothetical protein
MIQLSNFERFIMPRYFVVEVPDDSAVTVDTLRTVLSNPEVKITGGADSDKTAFVLLQQGGSSDSIYVHSHETEDDAEADRYNCRDNGAYNTSSIIEAPPLLSALGEVFYEFLDEFCRLANDMSMPEGDNPYAGEDDEALEDEGGLA